MLAQNQEKINRSVSQIAAANSRKEASTDFWRSSVPLRSSSAAVYFSGDYAYLRSYRTFVAAVNLKTGTGYDYLRKVYGYTATSAQHISKFFHDYNAREIKTWRV